MQERETFGRYELIERLGEGGMAEVFKAKSLGVEGFEKILVIKRILPHLAADPRFLELFIREAKLAVRLSHANIVQVFDLGRVEVAGHTNYFMAMEYVSGMDLAHVLGRSARRERKIPYGMVAYVGAEVCKGLDHAHRRTDERSQLLGIVHSDISPHNILVSWEGEVKVTDFGIAKAVGSAPALAVSGEGPTLIGKIAYMSPEQAQGGPIDHRSDQFSLGIILYEMLAGSNPFWDTRASEILRRVVDAEVPPIALVDASVPEPIANIVHRMLARDPDARFASVAEVHERLLGYFYDSEQRFTASDLSHFLRPFHHETLPPSPSTDLLEDGLAAKTPVEGRADPLVVPEGSATLAPPPEDEAREVTALAVDASGGDGDWLRAAEELALEHGGLVVERTAQHLVALFGVDESSSGHLHAATRVALLAGTIAPSSGSLRTGIDVSDVGIHHGEFILDERFHALAFSARNRARQAGALPQASARAGEEIRQWFDTEAVTDSVGSDVRIRARLHDAPGVFVGRKEELRQLGKWLALAGQQQGRVVCIDGPSGVGKSSLVYEMERRLRKGKYDIGFVLAVCAPGGERRPRSALVSMIRSMCGLEASDDGKNLERVVPKLRSLGLQEDEIGSVLEHLGRSAWTGEPIWVGEGIVEAAFRKMVHRLCDDRTRCFVWDRAEQMDPATLQLLGQIAHGPRSPRALFVLAGAPAGASLPRVTQDVTRLEIHPLQETEALQLVHTMTSESRVFGISEGPALSAWTSLLPFYLACYARLSAQDELASGTPNPSALLTLALGSLSLRERIVLEAASVLGSPCSREIVESLVGLPPGVVDDAIVGLSEAGFVRSLGLGTLEVRSDDIAKMMLGTISEEERRGLHLAAAQAYQRHPDRLGVFERAARHLREADRPDRAAECLAEEGRRAEERGQLEATLAHMLEAMSLAPPGMLAREGMEWLSRVLRAVGRLRYLPPDTSPLALLLEHLPEEQRALGQATASRVFTAAHRLDDARRAIEMARSMGVGATNPKEVECAELELSVREGDFSRAARGVTETLARGAEGLDGRFWLAAAHALAAVGRHQDALQALDQADRCDDPKDLGAATMRAKGRVVVDIFSRDFRGAAASAQRAIELARAAALRFETAAALHNMGDACRRLGDYPRAYACFAESLEISHQVGYHRLARLNYAHIALLDGLRGSSLADAILKEARDAARLRSDDGDLSEIEMLRGCLARHRGEVAEAKASFEEAHRLALARGNVPVVADAREALDALEKDKQDNATR